MTLNSYRRFVCPLVTALSITTAPAQTTHEPPVPDVADAALFRAGLSHDRGASTWYAGEKQTFTRLLSAGHFDWLIVPAQTQREGLDRAERSMMVAELTRAIVEHQLSTPDPYLVERALGEGQRRISLDEIDGLARTLRVKVIVVPYVGHDDSGNLWATLAVYRKPDSSVAITQIRPVYLAAAHARFSETVAPVESFIGVLPGLLTEMALPVQAQPLASVTSALPSLPESPEMLANSGEENPLDDAARFAVLGELAPPGTRAAERLFERCFLASRRAGASPEQIFLQAYALFRLNLRPAAAHVLHDTPTPGLVALKAIVNGNFTGTGPLIKRTSGYQRLILDFELNKLARAYGHAEDSALLPPTLTALANRSDDWRLLLRRQWQFGGENAHQSNVALKKMLDRIFPVAGESLEEILQAQASTPGTSFAPMDLELTAHEHIHHLVSGQGAAWCCAKSFYRPGPWDFLSVTGAWSDANLMLAVQKELDFRGLPDSAKDILSRLDQYFSGHPDFEVLHAETDLALARRLPEAQQTALRASARAHALQALLAAGGQTAEAISALGILGPDASILELAHGYGSDYPFNEAWLGNDFAIDQSKRLGLARCALANTQTGVGYATLVMLDGHESVKPEVRAALRGRFRGNPGLDSVTRQLEPGNSGSSDAGPAAVIARLREKVRSQPDVWAVRTELASWLEANRKYSEAEQVLVDFPAFRQERPSNPVYLSNIAAEAGHKFYWQGAELEARALYRIATRYDVSSEAEMTAAMRLRLLNDDLSGALAETERRADRYPNGTSYSNYLSLLHLLGRSHQAWKAFNLLLSQPLGPGPWESAMVGLRIAGTTEADLDRWVERPEISVAGTPAASWPATLLLMWATTDRAASAGTVERVASLAHQPTGLIEGDGRVASYPGVQPGNRYLVIRSDFRADQRPPLKLGTAVPSDQVLFAQALIPLQRGNFAMAVSRFDELAARYPIEREVLNADAVYALPDFAYASAQAHDPLQLEQFLKRVPPGTQFFELALAQAYFQAIGHHDDDSALLSMEQAFVLIEHLLGRTPSMEYQYADAAERLYRSTADKRFRDRAVTWSHVMQRLQPWTAWAYAIEAELADDPAARRAALVKAMFLDPLSPRLKAMSTADVNWARTQLSNGNPFLQSHRPQTMQLSVPLRLVFLFRCLRTQSMLVGLLRGISASEERLHNQQLFKPICPSKRCGSFAGISPAFRRSVVTNATGVPRAALVRSVTYKGAENLRTICKP
jgi:hypothetical protein